MGIFKKLNIDESCVRTQIRRALRKDDMSMPSYEHPFRKYYRSRNSACKRIINNDISFEEDKTVSEKLATMKKVLMNHLNTFRRKGARWDNIIQYLHPVDVWKCRHTCCNWYNTLYNVDEVIFREGCKAMVAKNPGKVFLESNDGEPPSYVSLTWTNQFHIMMNWAKNDHHFVSRSSDFMIPKSNHSETITTIPLNGTKDPILDETNIRAAAVIPYKGDDDLIVVFCDGYLYTTDTDLENRFYSISRLRLDGPELFHCDESVVCTSDLAFVSMIPDSYDRLACLDTARRFTILNSDSWIDPDDSRKVIARLETAPGYTYAFDGHSKTFAFLGPPPESPLPQWSATESTETKKEFYNQLYYESEEEQWYERNNTIYVYSYVDQGWMQKVPTNTVPVMTHQITLSVSDWTDFPDWLDGSGTLCMRGDFICVGYPNAAHVLLKRNPETFQYDCAMNLTVGDYVDLQMGYTMINRFGLQFFLSNGYSPDEIYVWNLSELDLLDSKQIQQKRELHWKNPSIRSPGRRLRAEEDQEPLEKNLPNLPLTSTVKTMQCVPTLHSISESASMAKNGVFADQERDFINMVLDRDETSIICSSRGRQDGERDVLVVWDFRSKNVPRAFDRHFVRRRLGELEFWFVYDVLPY